MTIVRQVSLYICANISLGWIPRRTAAKLPSKTIVPVTSLVVYECPFPHELANSVHIVDFNFCQLERRGKWRPVEVLICISKISSKAEHICLPHFLDHRILIFMCPGPQWVLHAKYFTLFSQPLPGMVVRREPLFFPTWQVSQLRLACVHTSSKCWWQQTLLLNNYTVSVLFFLSKRTQMVEGATTHQLRISPFQPSLWVEIAMWKLLQMSYRCSWVEVLPVKLLGRTVTIWLLGLLSSLPPP